MSVWTKVCVMVGIVVGIPLFVGAALSSSAATPEAGQPSGETVIVDLGEVIDTVSAVGRIEADRVVGVSFRAVGRVTEVLVQIGDTVQPGTVLARLDSTNAQLSYDQAALALEQAQVALRELQLAPTDAERIASEAAVTGAQGALAATQQTVSSEDIRAAEQRVQAAQERLENLRQGRSTLGGDEVPVQEISLAEAQAGQASFDAEITRLQLENLRIQTRGPRAEAAAALALAQLQLERTLQGTRPTQLAVADAAILRAEVRLDEAETTLGFTELISPAAGIVTRIGVQAGQFADMGLPVVDITDDSRLWLLANIDEVDVDQIAVGQATTIRLDALAGETFAATINQIAWINVLTNGVVNYPTRFSIESDDPRIRVGMTAEARVIVVARASVLRVPNGYLTLQGTAARVTRLVPGGESEPIEVMIGLRGDTYTEIIYGLREGDSLIPSLPL